MAIKPLLSFSSGELDPILTDNVTLEKFNKGLSTARNVMIGKTGSIMSRFSTKHFARAQVTNSPIRIYRPPSSDYLLEFMDSSVKIHRLEPFNTNQVIASPFVEADLPNLHFDTSGDNVWIFCEGKTTQKIKLAGSGSSFESGIFDLINPLTSITVTPQGSPAGFATDYFVSLVINGEETVGIADFTGKFKPIAVGQSNTIQATWETTSFVQSKFVEARIYSKPSAGAAFGLLGTSRSVTVSGTTATLTFYDLGATPDFEQGIPDIITRYGLDGETIENLKPKTGSFYQQRLVLGNTSINKEAVVTSRPGFHNNFGRDFPYSSDSALLFKAGTSGKANVLRILDNDGLIVFTTKGIYTNSGVLAAGNTTLDKRNGAVIKESLPPLVVPGGVFFVDIDNVIRQFIFNQDIVAYESTEQTIFSNHLFKKRTIKSWAYQGGTTPVIIVVFSDGNFATFTYNQEQQMRAWTRHDCKYPIEQVEGTDDSDESFFVVNKNGQRHIERSIPRLASADLLSTNPEAPMLENAMFADSIVSYAARVFEEVEDHVFSPVTSGDWSGNLNLDYPDQGFGPGLGPFTPTDTYRFFHPKDLNAIDLVCVSSSSTQTVFTPSEEFPSEYATAPRLYSTFTSYNQFGKLDHLEGEKVSVMVDGAIISSPYNDDQNYEEITVTGGAVDLPDGVTGSIIHIGRPIVADVKTLNISTLEQSPTLIESINVNKLYVRVNDSRGLYCDNLFPEEQEDGKDGTSVAGMDQLDEELVPQDDIIIGNRFFPPVSKRVEKTISGHWDSQGRVSLRQVDPYHFEILSIIPDVEKLNRSDR